MAKVEEIVVTYGKTIQVKQYEPSHLEVSIKVTLDKEDNPKDVFSKTTNSLGNMVHKKLEEKFGRS